MDKNRFYSFMHQVPKAEIHLHIEAVITLESVQKLYKERFGMDMSKEDRESLFSYSDLNGFIKAFLQVQDLFRTIADFNLVFDDFARYLESNNIVYCEAFFAPSAFLKKGFNYGEMIQNFSANIAKIKKEKNITIKLLVDVSRTFGLENAKKNYRLLMEHPCKDIIGIGLGGSEQKGPANLFGPVFEQAHKDGLHAVAHAGEDVGPESVWDALNILHAERIGHGITSAQDPELVRYLKESQIPLEVCPTSNVFTHAVVKNIEEHPVRKLFDEGVLITINTDDPVFFKTTLTDELWILHSRLGFSIDEIKTIICNGFKASFLETAKKEQYIAAVETAWLKNQLETV